MKKRSVRSNARIHLPLYVTALAGIFLSLAASAVVWQWEQAQSQQEFSATAQSEFLALQRGLDVYLSDLRALRDLFEAVDHVTRDEFESFAGRLLAGQKAIQNFSWVLRITDGQRNAHELLGIRDGLPDYQIRAVTPDNRIVASPRHDEYLPVFYSTEPRISPVYGIDLRSEPAIQQRLDRAGDTDTLSAVPDFVLHSKEGDVHGFLFSLPVYLRGEPHTSVEERRRNLAGFTHGAFLTVEAMDHIFSTTTTARGLDISLFLADASAGAAPLYFHSWRLRAATAKPQTLSALLAGKHEGGALNAGNTKWTLVATAFAGGPLSTSHDRAWLVLVAGFLMSGVVLQYMHASIRHAQRLLQANKEISSLAHRDSLTGLHNRRAFDDSLAAAFAASRRTDHPFAVLYFDLDHFKDVNDTLGHPIGDLLLQQVAERVLGAVRPTDVVARFGGDEFAILEPDADGSTAMLLARRINDNLDRPFKIDDNDMHVTASIGIAQYSKHIESPDVLIMQADLALYRAKADGRNCFRFHNVDLDREVSERVAVADDLRGAVDRGEMLLYYQPQVELSSGRVVGVEALLRWNHPRRGLLNPSTFVQVAEQTGIIIALGEWVIDQACRQMRTWLDIGITLDLIAVNISAVQFKVGYDVGTLVNAAIEKWRVIPSEIEIELTESVLRDATEQHSDSLDQLRKCGVRIAIDDFGTGYSSLNYLTTYPVNRLKIAQELVVGVITKQRNATVVHAAIRLAAELGIECLAEGIETAEQAAFVVEAGCAFGQGYYFSKPLDADGITDLLKQKGLRLGLANPGPAPLPDVRK